MTNNAPPTSPWQAGANQAGATQNVEADISDRFGLGTTNNILRVTDTTSSFSTSVRAVGLTGSSNVVTLSFNYYEPSGVNGTPWSVRFGNAGFDSDTNTLATITFNNGTIGATSSAYSLDAPHRIDLVLNNSGAAINDYSGTFDLPNRTYAVWVDGNRVIANNGMTAGVMTSNQLITSFHLRTFTASLSQEVYADNFYLFSGATIGQAIPEPSALSFLSLGTVFCAVWTMRRGRRASLRA